MNAVDHPAWKMTQVEAVKRAMTIIPGWWTFGQLRGYLQSMYGMSVSEAGVSARIRDLRKPPYNLTVERRPTGRKGIWEYHVAS